MTAPAFELPDFITTPTPSSMVRDAIRGAVSPQLKLVTSAEPAARPVLSFREFVDRVNPRYRWYEHCVRAAAVLQRVADGELKRVIICWPPRHGKTELLKLFQAYLVYRFPTDWVGLASYGATLANRISRAVRDFARLGGLEVRDDAAAVHEWETMQGGGLWSTGVGGPATGKGFKRGILDDPVKDAKEASSALIADRLHEWWSSVWYTRQEPDAALVVVTTRWPGPGDFVGWLLEQESADEQPERWHLVLFEAEKTAEPYVVPASCTTEPDWRSPGDALCPERYSPEKLRKIAKRIGSYFYNALFQQRPTHREGRMFRWEWWQTLKESPVCASVVRYWDLAGTEPKRKGHDPDFTASTLAGRMPDLRTCILDNVEFRESIGARDAELERIAKADRAKYGLSVTWWLETESGVGGADRTASLVRRLQALGITVRTEPATGSKLVRAEPLAAAAEAGNICLAPENGHRWHDRFRAHMGDFGANCAHDDTADATSGAYNKLAAPLSSVSFSTMSM